MKKKDTLVTEVVRNKGLKEAVAGNPDLRTSVANNLKGDKDFKDSVKGDPGQDGKSPSAQDVATQLLTDSDNKNTLVTEVAGNQVLKDAVTIALNSDDGFHSIAKRSTNANNAKQKFTLQKGEKLLDDTYEANIVSDDKTIATLPKIGYYMLNDQLVVRNHVAKEEVAIPRDFHY
ncbi:MAG: hypothetical protein ACR5KX_04785 [Wolbachia sp.]